MVSCCLKKVTENIASLPIEDLILKGNQIEYISEQVLSMPSITQMYMACNQIEYLEDRFNPNLQMFKFNGNRLTKIPKSVFDCKNLTKLEIMGNKLT